tara:strand:- start:514 stop:741 length:228 start_codon:yes stop_codon:yes gene_type:complete
MKNKEEEIKKLNNFTPVVQERMAYVESKIKEIKTKKTIDIQTVKELDNLISELLVIRSGFVDNLINWTKQGYLIE